MGLHQQVGDSPGSANVPSAGWAPRRCLPPHVAAASPVWVCWAPVCVCQVPLWVYWVPVWVRAAPCCSPFGGDSGTWLVVGGCGSCGWLRSKLSPHRAQSHGRTRTKAACLQRQDLPSAIKSRESLV